MYSKTIILGRLTADPELKQTPNGVAVTTFSVAVNRTYALKGEERNVDFYAVVAWRQHRRVYQPVLLKGFCHTGRRQHGIPDIQRQERKRSARVGAYSFQGSFTGNKNDSGGVELPAPQSTPSDTGADDFMDIDDSDSDLPF